MEGLTTPEHPRLTSIQHDSDLDRTSSDSASYYSFTTSTSDSKSNPKTILSPRVSFNDPNIVDVLMKLATIS
jgi:hypothetical protein